MSFSPPLLLGDCLQFQSEKQLEWFARHELREQRLTIIGSELTLFLQLEIVVQLSGRKIGRLTAMPVHQEADVYGLHITDLEIPAENLDPKFLAQESPIAAPADAMDSEPPTEVVSESTETVSDGTPNEARSLAPSSEVRPFTDKQVLSKDSNVGNEDQESDGGEFGGLLLDRYEDDTERFDVEASWTEPEKVPIRAPKSEPLEPEAPGEAHSATAIQQTRDGTLRRVTLLGALDDNVLMGMLMRLQTRCEVGELTLHSADSIWTLYTDRTGRLAFDEQTLEQIERGMPRTRVGGVGSKKKTPAVRVKEALINLLTELSENDFLHYRYVPRATSNDARHKVPFTVYICDVLLNLLKHHRLEEFKGQYEARMEHFVESSVDTAIQAKDYAMGRRAIRFFEIVSQDEHALRMLFKVSPVSQGETYRLLRMGELLNLLSFSRERLTKIDLSEEHLSFLQHQFSRSQDGYFEAIGVHMVTHPKMFQAALDGISAKFSKDSAYAQHSYRHRELCAQIVRLAHEAYKVLIDKKRRINYRKTAFDSSTLTQAADVLLEKADMNRLRGHDRSMKESLEMAFELDARLTREHVTRHREFEIADPSSSD